MMHKNLPLLVAAFCIAAPAFGQPLEPGDSDQDYDFDPYDIVLMQQGAKFGTGQPATWQDGDWNGGPGGEAGSPPAGDGVVNREDTDAADATKNYLGDVYARVKATPLGASDPILPGGVTDDNQTSIAYYNHTGVIAVDAPNGRQLSAILIESKSGIFSGAPAENVGANVFDIDTNTRVFRTVFGGGFSTFSLGAIAEQQHSAAFLLDDLKVSGALRSGGGLGPVDLVFLGPPLPDVLPGDADQDYDVDAYDFVQVLQAGKFGTGEPATWEEGDWNAVGGPPGNPPAGDGFFNEIDLALMSEVGQYRQGPYGPQETLRGQGTRVFAGGVLGDDRVSIVYVGETGEVALDVPPGVELTSIVIVSQVAMFSGATPENLGGPFDVGDEDAQIVKITFGERFSSLSFGRAAATGMDPSIVSRTLTATGARAGGGGLGFVDLVYLEEAPGFRRGDANLDGRVDIGDLSFLYHGLVPALDLGLFQCPAAADTNDSVGIDLTDTTQLIRWLSGGALSPVTPGPFECGRQLGGGLVHLACPQYPVFLCGELPERPEDERFSFRFGDVPETIEGAPGTLTVFDVTVQICNGLPVRAWSIGVVAGGAVSIIEARTEGTLANPAGEGGQNRVLVSNQSSEQAMSFVALGTDEPAALPLTVNGVGCEPREVLILTLRAAVPPSGVGVGSLEFVDGVDFTGWPIDNLVAYTEGEDAPEVARPQLESRTFTVGSPPCPPDPVRCEELTVSGPADGGPGTYTASIVTADGGGSPLYQITARNETTAANLVSPVRAESSAQFELTEGAWTFRGAVTDGFRCIGSACDEVTVQVQCVEAPDSISISGLTEAQVGSVVEVVATFQGLDPGATVNGYSWEIAAGSGQLVGTAGPVARVRSTVPGEVSVRVIAGDSLCQDVSVASHQIEFREECPASLRADCQTITVTGPEDEGPGEYEITVGATFPAGVQPLYFFRIENPATGERVDAGPVPGRVARVPDLPPGRWIISAAAGVDPECPFDACSPVEVIVRCLEAPDSVAISGAEEAQAGTVVELAASLEGADAGGSVAYRWEVVSGAGEIVGADDRSTVDVMGTTGGEVMVRVRSGDGICEDDAEAVHAILFQDCPPPESISCDGVEVEGPPGNAPGEYRITVAATVPANERTLYFYRIENPLTGQSATAGPGPSSRVIATLPVGTWDVHVAVGTDSDCPFVACASVPVVVAETVGQIGPFIRSDCNADQRLDIADALCILEWIHTGGAAPGCAAASNANGDGAIDTSDAIYLLLFGFAEGAEPVAPFPTCGTSATEIDRALGCETPPAYCQ